MSDLRDCHSEMLFLVLLNIQLSPQLSEYPPCVFVHPVCQTSPRNSRWSSVWHFLQGQHFSQFSAWCDGGDVIMQLIIPSAAWPDFKRQAEPGVVGTESRHILPQLSLPLLFVCLLCNYMAVHASVISISSHGCRFSRLGSPLLKMVIIGLLMCRRHV